MPLTIGQKIRGRLVAITILCIAIAVIFFLSTNWTTWAGEGEQQKTDDAYVRADVTPLSTKAAGIVASVEVADYQSVKAGNLLVRLRDEDFRAQVNQAEAAVRAGESNLVNNQRQKELQDARVEQAVADEERFRAQRASREAEIESARAQLASREADLNRARAHLESARAEL